MGMQDYIVTEVTKIAPNTISIKLNPERGARKLRYEAGQYAALSFTINGRPSTVRCFTIVSAASQGAELEFAMRVTGRFTKTAAQLKPGDMVSVQGPFGDFTLENGQSRNAVFFAGGIGVTPFISMIRDVTQRSIDMSLTLVYSCRTQDDIPFGDELAELEHDNPNLSVIYVIANGEIDKLAGRKVLRGAITPEAIDRIMRQSYDPYNFYICGPKGYMKTIKKALLGKQVDPEAIFVEEFGVRSKGMPSLFSSMTGRVYSGTAVGLLMAIVVVTGIDLKSTIAKAVATNPALAAPTQTQTTPAVVTTGSSSSSSAATTTPVTQQTQTTYQQPVSTVS
jgi:ferredoxin-NADP reductase